MPGRPGRLQERLFCAPVTPTGGPQLPRPRESPYILSSLDPETGGGDASPAGTQRRRVQVVRHHSSGLP